MYMWIIPIIIILLAGIVLFVLYSSRKYRFPYVKFFLRGKEADFSFGEIMMLRKVAMENRLKDPTSIFWSLAQLDNSLKSLIIKYRSQGEEENETNIDFISKLFEFRIYRTDKRSNYHSRAPGLSSRQFSKT
jgi:hypothetical protein